MFMDASDVVVKFLLSTLIHIPYSWHIILEKKIRKFLGWGLLLIKSIWSVVRIGFTVLYTSSSEAKPILSIESKTSGSGISTS